jgi:hypothetical protein
MTGYWEFGGQKKSQQPTADSQQPKEVKAHGGTVDFDKLLDFLYDYQCGVWTYGVLINP